MDSEKKKFTILSIDGGGIRGLIPAKVLADTEQELKRINPEKSLYEYFDLICGTSTGAIIAIGIALGIPGRELLDFYKDNAKIIFPKWYLKFLPQKSRALVTSIYSNRKLRAKLHEVYTKANGEKTPMLADLKTRICVPTFNGNEGQINVLKTRHHNDYFRDYKLPAHEVALASASAPVYFPPHTFQYSNEHGSGVNVNMIDGGIFANNPSLIGLLEATEKLGNDFSNVRLLSIGTGKGKHIIKSNWRPKDLLYWFVPKPRLLDIILDSQAQITEQYINFIQRITNKSGESFDYLRIQHDLGGDTIDLDASDKRDIQRLEAIGSELSKNNLKNILHFITK